MSVYVRVARCIKLSLSSQAVMRACAIRRGAQPGCAAAHYAGSWSFLPLSTEVVSEREWVRA